MFPIRKILHPTDYSDPSRSALEMACALARDFGAELVVCHVAPPPVIAAGDGLVVELPSGETDEQVAARLERVEPDAPGVPVMRRPLRGDPVSEIVRLADELDADLIVLGTHGRSGLSRLLLGSVAEGVMRKAPCPVVTVKAVAAGTAPKAVAAAASAG